MFIETKGHEVLGSDIWFSIVLYYGTTIDWLGVLSHGFCWQSISVGFTTNDIWVQAFLLAIFWNVYIHVSIFWLLQILIYPLLIIFLIPGWCSDIMVGTFLGHLSPYLWEQWSCVTFIECLKQMHSFLGEFFLDLIFLGPSLVGEEW